MQKPEQPTNVKHLYIVGVVSAFFKIQKKERGSITCSVPQGQLPFACALHALHAENKIYAKQVSKHATTKTNKTSTPKP